MDTQAAIRTDISSQEALNIFADKRVSARLEALDLRTEILRLEKARTAIRDEIKFAVANEVGEDKKPIYSNEDKRKAERDRREAEHAELRKVNEGFDQLYRRTNILEVNAAYYADMIHIGCAFAGQE